MIGHVPDLILGGPMAFFRATAVATLALATLSACDSSGGVSASRNQVRAVGSSTVYPFATAVAEQFVNTNAKFKSPIIESTGTGAGFKLFCAGVGAAHPDISNASRRIKKSEYEMCAKNGVDKIIELQIGLDGIAFAESSKGLKIPLTLTDVYKALAATPFGKPQTAKTWKDVNPALPAEAIKVYGPPSTSGTRDALVELILVKGCDTEPAMVALKASNEEQHKKICSTIREDGAFVDAGENDNLIVQKIEADPKALGIFGFSFFEENKDKLVANTLDGKAPTYFTISDFSYPGARPLYIYVKAAHLNAVPGLKEYVAEFAQSWAPGGFLSKRGMVVAPGTVRDAAAITAKELTPLDPSVLK
jgi:phosphate transport system substrate-binding protein